MTPRPRGTAASADTALSLERVAPPLLALDDARTMQLVTQRRQQAWAGTYKERAARLEARAIGATYELFGTSGPGIGHGLALLRELSIEKSVHWSNRL